MMRTKHGTRVSTTDAQNPGMDTCMGSSWETDFFTTKIAQSQLLAISALTEPNRQKSRREKGFWAQTSQPETANR